MIHRASLPRLVKTRRSDCQLRPISLIFVLALLVACYGPCWRYQFRGRSVHLGPRGNLYEFSSTTTTARLSSPILPTDARFLRDRCQSAQLRRNVSMRCTDSSHQPVGPAACHLTLAVVRLWRPPDLVAFGDGYNSACVVGLHVPVLAGAIFILIFDFEQSCKSLPWVAVRAHGDVLGEGWE